MEWEQRERVVAEALTWVGTPYVGNADVKGAGVDCGMLLVRCFADVGLIEPFDPRPYPLQWSLHQSAERFLTIVLRFAREVDREPLPGDVVLFRFGKSHSHGSICVGWPLIVHATPPGPCVVEDAVRTYPLARLAPRAFTLRSWG